MDKHNHLMKALKKIAARRATVDEEEFIAARTAAWNTVHQQTGLPRPKDEPKINILRGDGPGRSTTTSLSFHLHEEAHPYVEKN